MNVYFSDDNKWVFLLNGNDSTSIYNLQTEQKLDFLYKQRNISKIITSQNNQYITTISNHKITTWDFASGKPIQSLWVNREPTRTFIFDNRYLIVIINKTIIKTDLQTQQGDLFSYGDGETLDYSYEEIQEWIKVFGNEYLGQLSNETKQKYGIKD